MIMFISSNHHIHHFNTFIYLLFYIHSFLFYLIYLLFILFVYFIFQFKKNHSIHFFWTIEKQKKRKTKKRKTKILLNLSERKDDKMVKYKQLFLVVFSSFSGKERKELSLCYFFFCVNYFVKYWITHFIFLLYIAKHWKLV